MTFVEIYCLNSLLITPIWWFAGAGCEQLWKDRGCSSSGGRRPVNPAEICALETHNVLFPFHLEPFSRLWIIPSTSVWKGGDCKFTLLVFLLMPVLALRPQDGTGCVRFSSEARTESFLSLSYLIWTSQPLEWQQQPQYFLPGTSLKPQFCR